MTPQPKYRHICQRCGHSRSKEFHRKHPAGPGHPSVHGICRRCILPHEIVQVHIHHFWYMAEAQPSITSTTETTDTTTNERPPKLELKHNSEHQLGWRPSCPELPLNAPVKLPPGRAELPSPDSPKFERWKAVVETPPPMTAAKPKLTRWLGGRW
jgi:hypothetical protein